MTKPMKKEFRREVKSSFARFLSILLIVTLGTAFFSGIKSAAPAMRKSADAMYDIENFMDICVAGTLGVTDSDIKELIKIAGVSGAEGAYSGEFLCSGKASELVTTVISLNDSINLVKVTKGRFPEKYDECIADKKFLEASGYEIGDKIKFTTGNDTEISETLATDTYTIVGIGTTSYYLDNERGNASIGDGTVDGFIVLPKEAFSLSCYTKIFITVDGAAEENCFSGKYKNEVEKIESNIRSIADTRCKIRYDEFKKDSVSLISKAENKFEAKKQEVMDQFEASYKALSDAQTELDTAQAEIDARKQEIADAQELLDMQEMNLEDGKTQIEEAKVTLADLKTRYETTDAQLKQVNKVIEKMEEELRVSAGGMTNDEYAEQAFTIFGYKATAQIYQAQLDTLGTSIKTAEQRISDAEAIINGSPETIAAARETLAQGDEEIAKAQAVVTEKQNTLNTAKEEYELSKADVVEELNEAQAKLDKYKEKIQKTEVPVWYVTGREAISSYASFSNDAEGISAIGLMFPIIFFLVAALVSLTTMTRMVEEQRTQIGTFKALGYSKFEITKKYFLYALYATLFGSVIGVVLGEAFIPKLVVETYKIVYVNLTKTVVTPNVLYAVIAIAIAVICTTGAGLAASRKFLKETPASLMRPETPKIGKKIFLEKIDGFWLRLNFAQKAALRNLFRYKKRLFMTVFGVAGCMALLLVGFGIRDSVSSMTGNQFDKIWNYDGTITVNESLTRTERRHLLSSLQKTGGVNDYLQTYRTLAYANAGEKENDAYVVVPQNVDFLGDYITLKSRTGNNTYTLTDNSVIITEKLANLLGVKAGDKITLKTEKEGEPTVEIPIAGVVENYIYHYIYMSPATYRSLFGESPSLNTLLLRSNVQNTEGLSENILKINGITSVTMNVDIQKQVDSTMDKLMIIVILMIASAALLAFVVLYNLNNINITERKRELATLKVLGFFDDEIEKYVYRENIILTIIGGIIGIVLGVVLHFFVMKSVETDTMMFGRYIGWHSYILSIILTAIFSIFVNFLMTFKLKAIDMIESLKSVE